MRECARHEVPRTDCYELCFATSATKKVNPYEREVMSATGQLYGFQLSLFANCDVGAMSEVGEMTKRFCPCTNKACGRKRVFVEV